MRSGVDRVLSLVDVLHLNLQFLPLVVEEGVREGAVGSDALGRVAAQQLLEEVAAGGWKTLEQLRVEIYLAFAVLLDHFLYLFALEQRLLEQSNSDIAYRMWKMTPSEKMSQAVE
jgi:hypothetical protein